VPLTLVVLASILCGLLGCALKAGNHPNQEAPDEPAAQVHLSWAPTTARADGTPATDLAGYRIYYGQARGKYSFVKTVGNQTSAGIAGLVPGQTYYFAVTAYDSSGAESGLSDEISMVVPTTLPTIPTLMQEALTRGQAAQFWVAGATPGEIVSFLFSETGPGEGPCSPQLGGLCVDILEPQTFGEATADAFGTAILTRLIPADMPPGQTISIQAVIRRGPEGTGSLKTNAITARVVE
jgi:hypothetical protein